jgi:hypothetical protein
MQLGKILLATGAALAAAGVALILLEKTGLGRLPGDIVIERPGFTFYFPVVTSLVLSLVLSLIFWMFRR